LYKATIRCEGIRTESMAAQLDNATRRFKAWNFKNAAYASLELKSMSELGELVQKLSKCWSSGVDLIKVEKADDFD